MYEYWIVELRAKDGISFNLMDIPYIETLKIFVSGKYDDLHINAILEAESSGQKDVTDKLEQKLKNLKLYLNLFTDYKIDINVIDNGSNRYPDKETCVRRKQDVFESLKEPNLSKFMDSRITQHNIILQEALDEITLAGDIFNGFPKLINWIDENDHKGSSRFCAIRDCCLHGIVNHAYKKVNELFPGEFEFEDNILKRDSPKNEKSMKKYLPEVLEHVKKTYKKNIIDAPHQK